MTRAEDPATVVPDGARSGGPPRVGLVLGAGGTVGQAFQAGVLAALEHDLGWDPRGADVIVGTSAGAITATLLRLGIPAHDLAAWAVQAPLSVEGAPLRRWLGERHPDFPPVGVRNWLRPWRLPSPALLRRVLRQPWAVRPLALAMTLLPAGPIELLTHTNRLDDMTAEPWPDGLWLCAARRDDGARVTFGRDGAQAALPEAVAASCAIPGYFTPIQIAGQEYFDGGAHSSTNADLLRGLDLDVVVTVAPLSAAPGTRPGLDRPLRIMARRRLTRELEQLDRDTPAVRFEPDTQVLEVMGHNLMATDALDRVVQEAFVEAGASAAREVRAGRLAALDARARHS
jgi:NTE family protein